MAVHNPNDFNVGEPADRWNRENDFFYAFLDEFAGNAPFGSAQRLMVENIDISAVFGSYWRTHSEYRGTAQMIINGNIHMDCEYYANSNNPNDDYFNGTLFYFAIKMFKFRALSSFLFTLFVPHILFVCLPRLRTLVNHFTC